MTVECLTFDISGDFGFFKKFYTTSSPLTYEFPPKTSLTGIIGAILGLSFEERYEMFKCKFGIRILNPIEKIYVGINWLNTRARTSRNFPESNKEFLDILNLPPKPDTAAFLGMAWLGQSPHTQAKLELLKKPKYRIYYPNTNKYFNELSEHIKEHKSYYTPFLGISEFICNFKFNEIFQMKKIENNSSEVKISSVVPVCLIDMDQSNPINFNFSNLYKVNAPNIMEYPRIVKSYENIIYNPIGKAIKVIVKEFFKLKNKNNEFIENVVLF